MNIHEKKHTHIWLKEEEEKTKNKNQNSRKKNGFPNRQSWNISHLKTKQFNELLQQAFKA